jgi:hypothetical protein
MQIRVLEHHRHVDARLDGVAHAGGEIVERETAAVWVRTATGEAEVLERHIPALQAQLSRQRTERARDCGVTPSGVA